MGQPMKFTAVFNDQVSKGLEDISRKLVAFNSRVKDQGQQQAAETKKAVDRIVAEVDKGAKQRIALQRASISQEESLRAKTQAEYERWWQRQLAIGDRAEKEKTAKQEREDKQRIALQRNSLALAEAQQARESQRNLQNTKYLQDSALRIERQAAQAEAALVLDRFDRRIAVERVKHAQILADLKGNDAAIEAENKRHQAVVDRVSMDKANFSNTPFQKMLESFNKLNQGLGKATPILTTAAAQVGTMSGTLGSAANAVNGFGGALSSFALGPAGIAIAAVTALSLGINKLIDDADRAASLRADLGTNAKNPAQLQQMIEIQERYAKARASVGKNVVLAGAATFDPAVAAMKKASEDWKAIVGKRLEDEDVWTLERLQKQKAAADKTTDLAKAGNEEARRLDNELLAARADLQNKNLTLVEDNIARQKALEEVRFKEATFRMADHDKNFETAKAIHLARMAKIDQDAEQQRADAAAADSQAKRDFEADKAQKAMLEQERARKQAAFDEDAKRAKARARLDDSAETKNVEIRAMRPGTDRKVAELEAAQKTELETLRRGEEDHTILHEDAEHRRTAINKYYSDERKRIDAEELQARVAATASLAVSIGQIMQIAAGKNRALAKTAMRIEEFGAIASTAAGIMHAFGDSGNGNFYTRLAAAAAVGATGAAQVATIQSQIGKFARGTDYAPGGMALVGEQGPEMVYLPRGSQVKTAGETRQMMGPQQVVINVHPAPGTTVSDARAMGAAAADGYRARLKEWKQMERDSAYMGVVA